MNLTYLQSEKVTEKFSSVQYQYRGTDTTCHIFHSLLFNVFNVVSKYLLNI